ncbi:HAUS augmin-like complex subunit 7 isoform X1 [Oncorhynchus mykiss]|uniref:HAUS augmin-like complex subunit 7 isoform X1 n=1 Tax=Oncorhynchus mykiss TaxID=8022 RepID=UPI001877CD90|nr:HAUS augmin-like complex subunit 7 isoform X1 [Oncorhynchus mykiss]
MAATSKEHRLSQHVYATLQTLSCSLVEGLYLREADSMQELLCTPSQHRTDILAWICSSICPSLSKKLPSLRSKDPISLSQELAVFGQEMMLCRTDDLDLITGRACPLRQLWFLEQLLTLVPDSVDSSEDSRAGGEGLLKELFCPEALPHLTHALTPTLNPWPSDIRGARKGQRSLPSRPRGEEVAGVTALLESTLAALEQLHDQCVFLRGEEASPSRFSVCALRVAVSDLAQMMSVFSRVYDTDFRSYCSRDPPSLRSHTHIFSTVHRLLTACNTELEVLRQVSEVSVCLSDTVNEVHSDPCYWSHGHKHTLCEYIHTDPRLHKHTLSTQLEHLTKRYTEFLSLHHGTDSKLPLTEP